MSTSTPRRWGVAVALYLLGIFMGAIDTGIITPARTVIQSQLGVDEATGIWMITIYTLAYAAAIPVMGKLADRYGRKPVMLWSRVALMVLTYPVFMMLINNPSFGLLALATTVLAGLTAIGGAPSVVAIPELFPAPIRALGMSVAYAVGVAVFGGSTQAIVTWLIQATGNPAAPALYVVATSVVTLIAIVLLPETGRDATLHH